MKVDIQWANEEGEFLLSDGTYGNPGCDGCGIYDAVVKMGHSYYCEEALKDDC